MSGDECGSPRGPAATWWRCTRGAYAPLLRDVVRPYGEARTQLRLSLEAGQSLTGRTVVRGTNEPLPLVELALTAHGRKLEPWQSAEAPAEERVYASSDERGNFRVEGLAPGQLPAGGPGAGARTRGAARREGARGGPADGGPPGGGCHRGLRRGRAGPPGLGRRGAGERALAPGGHHRRGRWFLRRGGGRRLHRVRPARRRGGLAGQARSP